MRIIVIVVGTILSYAISRAISRAKDTCTYPLRLMKRQDLQERASVQAFIGILIDKQLNIPLV